MSPGIDHLSHLVLIAGLSGAGKSTATNALSDLGFYTIDHLPVALLPQVIDLSRKTPQRFSRTCLFLDIDSPESVADLMKLFGKRETWPDNLKLIFLDCTTNAIIRRYSETRRPHPSFDSAVDKTLEGAIERERNLLLPLREISHFVIGTSELNVHDLKREITEVVKRFASDIQKLLRLNFVSFGFKYGLPPDCDQIMDVRFLPNPHFEPELRDKTGLDREVSDFVFQSEEAQQFLEKFKNLLDFLLPHYAYEGKAYLNIGIGCTGGRHRSVAIAERLAAQVSPGKILVSVKHRDLARPVCGPV